MVRGPADAQHGIEKRGTYHEKIQHGIKKRGSYHEKMHIFSKRNRKMPDDMVIINILGYKVTQEDPKIVEFQTVDEDVQVMDGNEKDPDNELSESLLVNESPVLTVDAPPAGLSHSDAEVINENDIIDVKRDVQSVSRDESVISDPDVISLNEKEEAEDAKVGEVNVAKKPRVTFADEATLPTEDEFVHVSLKALDESTLDSIVASNKINTDKDDITPKDKVEVQDKDINVIPAEVNIDPKAKNVPDSFNKTVGKLHHDGIDNSKIITDPEASKKEISTDWIGVTELPMKPFLEAEIIPLEEEEKTGQKEQGVEYPKTPVTSPSKVKGIPSNMLKDEKGTSKVDESENVTKNVDYPIYPMIPMYNVSPSVNTSPSKIFPITGSINKPSKVSPSKIPSKSVVSSAVVEPSKRNEIIKNDGSKKPVVFVDESGLSKTLPPLINIPRVSDEPVKVSPADISVEDDIIQPPSSDITASAATKVTTVQFRGGSNIDHGYR